MRKLLIYILVTLMLAACGTVPPTSSPTPRPAPTASATSPAPTHAADSQGLRIWVTPRFDPAADSLLQARLDAFAEKHTGLEIEVRVKQETSLIEALQLTVSAAPGASPDLIVFSRANLESAVAQGLIQPVEQVLSEDVPWHPLARSLGQVKDSVYGIPFALDALVLGTTSEDVLVDWRAISEAGTLMFNVNDASIPLALYLSAGGALTDGEGRLALDEAALTRALALFAGGDFQVVDSDEQVAAALAGGNLLAVGWVSDFPTDAESNVRLDALPGLESPSASFVTGWCWSITSTDLERRELALELAEWLTTGDFLGEWIPTLGYLPPYQDARWKPLLDLGFPVPPAELVEAVSPVLREAVIAVLNGTSPEEAAKAAAEKLKESQ